MVMTTISKTRKGRLALVAMAIGALAACSDAPTTTGPDAPLEARHPAAGAPGATSADANSNAANTLVRRQLAELRRATAGFHRPEQADAAGYTILVRHPVSNEACFEDPALGGMGRHLLNPDLMDDEVLVPSPEALIYEPGPNGDLRLVGVEYVIPFDIRGQDEAPPVLFGQEFKQNFTFGLWALHVWPWKHNPSGMFEDWNPSVSCQHDGHVAP
jgi:hypothetical protein